MNVLLMILRLAGRSLACVTILGFLAAVWNSGTAVVDSIRETGSTEQETGRADTGERFGQEGEPIPRTVRSRLLAQEDQAVKVAAFEEFRRKSAGFWNEEYRTALALAEERIARETEQAIETATAINAAAQRTAERVARETNARHYREALRVANEQAAASAKATARIARQQELLAEVAVRRARRRLAAEEAAARLMVQDAVAANHRVSPAQSHTEPPVNRRPDGSNTEDDSP